MKPKYLILFLLALISFQLKQIKAQTYYPLVDTNKVWSNLWLGQYRPNPATTSFIKFVDDTVIGSIFYKKVFQSDDYNQSQWTEVGYIREDSTQKVYYYFKQDSVEKLIYDFSAAVGDTLTIGRYGYTLVVDSIDSVFIFDRYRKQFCLKMTGSFGGEKWIEGIGSNCGILASGNYSLSGGIFRLLCFCENDTLKYINPVYNDCYITTVGIDEITRPDIKCLIFPNPVTSFSILKIEGVSNTSYALEIYNVIGEKVKTLKLNENNEAVINRNDFPQGLFIYKLIVDNSNFITGKFLIN